jgi:lysophospholipase L1-like esterase
VRALISALNAVCRDQGVPFLGVFDALESSKNWMREVAAGDGAHPAAKGYEALALLIDGWPAWRANFP